MAGPGKNQGDLQGLNRALVMRLIHRHRICSRAQLARETGLTKASITGIIQQLMDAGVIREVGLMEKKGSRPSMGLSLCADQYFSIGLRLTRRHIRGGLFDMGGAVYETKECMILPETPPQAALAMMKEITAFLLSAAAGRCVLGIGIATPGPIIRAEGKIAYMSAFPGWADVSIPDEMEKEFHLPVVLEHDGVCCALWEWWNRPPGEEYRAMLCVLAGQGIGAGILMDGEPIRGALGCAGEIGHMSMDPEGPPCDCGNRGCLETYVSTLALEKEMAGELEKAPEHPLYGAALSAREILGLAQRGDPLARKVFCRQGEMLGRGMVNLVNLLNPDYLVITDELAACDELLLACVDGVLKKYLSPRIYQAVRLSVRPGSPFQAMQAASALILDRFLSEPAFFGQIRLKGE